MSNPRPTEDGQPYLEETEYGVQSSEYGVLNRVLGRCAPVASDRALRARVGAARVLPSLPLITRDSRQVGTSVPLVRVSPFIPIDSVIDSALDSALRTLPPSP